MTLVSVVSFLVPASSLIAKGGAFHQIIKNFRRKSANGISAVLFAAGIVSYSTFSFYGFLKHDMPTILAQVPGIILYLIVAGQIAWYGKKARLASEAAIEEVMQ